MERTLLIGLGNPGEEYAGTYHNAGWEFLDFLKEKLELQYSVTQSNAKQGKGFRFYEYGPVRLVYPDTFMNRSGEAVKAALAWFDKKPEETAVFHDDSDLATGEYREATGSAAGHHGIESVLAVVGESPILRVRIGIRDPHEKSGTRPRRKAGEFVLKKISREDAEVLQQAFKKLSEQFLPSATA